MKYTIPISLSIFLYSTLSFAQQCKTKVGVDDFTGETKLYSQGVEVIARLKVTGSADLASWYLRLSFEKEGAMYMRVRHETNDNFKLSLVTGLDIKFDDGSVLRLSNPIDKGEQAGKFLVDRWSRNYSSLFTLTEEQLDAFALKKAVKCRVTFANNYLDSSFEKELKANRSIQLQKEAKCFLETMLSQE